MLKSILILGGTLFGVVFGYSIAMEHPDEIQSLVGMENADSTFAVLLGLIFYLIASLLGRELQERVEQKLNTTNSYDLVWNSVGFALGVLIANLLLIPFYMVIFSGYVKFNFHNVYLRGLFPVFTSLVPLCFNLLFAYLGIVITKRFRRFKTNIDTGSGNVKVKIFDTSAVMDGRCSDIFRLGFIEGNVLIPIFVKNELQLMSESAESFRAERGSRALSAVARLIEDFPDNVALDNKNFPEVEDINAKLFKLASSLNGVIVTGDGNFKKIADMESVPCLNINDLANAVKPMFVCGEEIEIKIVKHGKDGSQGVGFLPDGTMVVIEDGGNHVGETASVRVNNILQTGAGRMVFCRMSLKDERDAG